MDPAWHEEMTGLVRGVLIQTSDGMTPEEATVVDDLLDHNEYGLALEFIADYLSERESPLSQTVKVQMVALAARMGLGGRVEGALEFCPVVDG